MKPINGILLFMPMVMLQLSCGSDNAMPSRQALDDLKLKKGPIVLCGPPEKGFGIVNFDITGSDMVRKDFNVAVELLHSFEYDEAEKVFAKIIDESPGCVMAYWGVAMCNFHPLWEPPTEAELIKGSKAISIANSITSRRQTESAYIDAVASYYKDWSKTDPHSRCLHFENAMERLHRRYPKDMEAVIFYALALDAAADPTDKGYSNQKKAGAILDSLYASAPNHPGIIHYIIHTYDYPGLASMALPAAKRYAEVAPSSAHALHMPSHIFTRLGLWDESIRANIRSIEAARCYAESLGIKGHWDEELHGLDYLIYAYLQKGDNKCAEDLVSYLGTIGEAYPVDAKVAYTFAAAPVRMALENRNWAQAALLQLQPASISWGKFPWQEAIVHFGRLLGQVHLHNAHAAESELSVLDTLYGRLERQNDAYKAKQLEIQITAGKAWIANMNGKKSEAMRLMKQAADREDSISKPPVTPGEVLPARELYADLLSGLHANKAALGEYVKALWKCPNRFNSLYGAGLSAERSGDRSNAVRYYKQLLAVADSASGRPELAAVRVFLAGHAMVNRF